MIIIKCKKCGKEKKIYPCRLKDGNGKFCSNSCSNSYNNSGSKNHFTRDKYNKKGKDAWNWKGGKTKLRGYVMVLVQNHPYIKKDGYVAEHRLVMEEKIGRYLDPKEIVHHINHIKDDNRPENLMLFKSNKDHMKNHGRNKGFKMHPNTRKALEKLGRNFKKL